MKNSFARSVVVGALVAALVWGVGGAEAACRLNAPAALRAKAAEGGSVRVIVELETDFRPEGSLVQAQAFLQRHGIATLRDQVLARLGSGVARASVKAFETIPYFAAQVDRNGLEALLNDPGVASVQEDTLSKADLAQSVPLIHAPEAWEAGYAGSGWAVAVLDTGVDKTHPFLAGKVVSEACYSTTDAGQPCQSACPEGASESIAEGAAVPPVGGDYGDRFYHGTHVAGIAAGHDASSSGVARDGNIIAVQVFSWFPEYYGPGQGAALSWASDQIKGLERVYSLRNAYQIAAVNMSLGGGKYFSPCDSDARKAIIDNLRSVGIATVISSGNNGYTDATGAPGCISTAVTVGATTKSDVVATYSNSASFVDVLAPGSSINSSIPGGGFASWNGTSMAAPHVAGAFAVIRTAYPDLTVDQIENALKQTGVEVSDVPRGVSPQAITKPRIRVKEAIDALASGTLSCQALLPGHGAGGHAASLDVRLRPAAGGADTAVAVTSNADGTFSVTPPSGGSWHVAVKERRTLATVRTGTPGGAVLDFGTLRAGDANNDNKVTIVDFSILATTFGKSAGEAGYDDRGDFNGDGQVTIVDFSLLASNFGKTGDELPAAEAGASGAAASAPEKPAGNTGPSSGETSGCQVAPGLGAVLLALPLGLVFWKP